MSNEVMIAVKELTGTHLHHLLKALAVLKHNVLLLRRRLLSVVKACASVQTLDVASLGICLSEYSRLLSLVKGGRHYLLHWLHY